MLTPQWQMKTPIRGSSPSFQIMGLGTDGLGTGSSGSGTRTGFLTAFFLGFALRFRLPRLDLAMFLPLYEVVGTSFFSSFRRFLFVKFESSLGSSTAIPLC
jgi:hypothetical protein